MTGANARSDAPRSVASLQILVGIARENGVSPRACLAGTGLDESDLADGATMVTADQELAAIRNLVRHVGDAAAFGLSVGLRYHFTSLGVVGLALVSSPTLGSAMAIALRYIDLTFALTRVAIERTDTECHVVLSADETPTELRRFALERSVGVLFTLARDLFGDVMLCRRVAFDFAAPSPDAPRRYGEILGIEPVFGAARTEVVLDRAELDRPIVQASLATRELAEAQCHRLMADRRARVGFSERVRARIAKHGGRVPEMEAVAIDLGVSARTLRRRLADEGTTYTALADEVRETFAEELLEVEDLSVDQVADRLGYADATSFIAAFRRWKGTTPRRYRERSKGTMADA